MEGKGDPDENRPLGGAVVLVTRPFEEGSLLAGRIEALGGRAILLPMIRIAPPENRAALEGARREVARAAWVAVTSRHGASAFFGGLPLPAGKRPRVGAVGRSTGEAVLRAGWPVDRTAPGRGAATLAEAIAAEGRLDGALVYHPRSSLARGDLSRRLEAAGAEVFGFEAYRTLPPGRREKERLAEAAGSIDLALFASPSAVRHYAGIAPPGDPFERILPVSIGPTTTAALREAGARAVFQSDRPENDGLLGALAAAWREAGKEKRKRR